MVFFLPKNAASRVFSFSGIITGLLVLLIFTAKPVSKMPASYTILCMGDSYTIGESVAANENFPNQTVQLLRKAGREFEIPEIIAKTGWTTDELEQAISKHEFKPNYDFVTLLIGVNNQYRGRTVENYKSEFDSLLKQAIGFAGSNPDHVIVLSIPDWGVTPFAKDRDSKKIASEIDDYNTANKEISSIYHVHYLDITPGTREVTADLSLLAADGLHPSAKEYARWAEQVSTIIQTKMKQ
jgi:lysophospholipase L1-like esterase